MPPMREPLVQPDHGNAPSNPPARSSSASAVAVPLLALGLLAAAVWLGSIPSQPQQPSAGSAVQPLPPAKPVDPLPSWNQGPTKQAILAFVAAVTDEAGPDFVPVPERVAVFDHDGTLACERPLLNGLFIVEQVRGLVARDPSLASEEPYATLLSGDLEFMRRLGRRFVNEVAAATLDGVPATVLDADVRAFLASARHPLFDVPLAEVSYTPMKELLDLLGKNGFSVWLCSGSSVHFIRPLAEAWYGIGPDRVIGSRPRGVMVEAPGEDGAESPRLDMVLLPEIELFNDGPQKPVSIAAQVGRRPILAVGNVAGGDLEMLRWSQSSGRLNLQLIVLHDDADREVDYGDQGDSDLEAARRAGWHIVSMASDWNRVFANPLVKQQTSEPADTPPTP